jgi:hypothetical protein
MSLNIINEKKLSCKDGFLVSIHNEDEMDFVESLIKTSEVWIGLETNGLTSLIFFYLVHKVLFLVVNFSKFKTNTNGTMALICNTHHSIQIISRSRINAFT